MAGRCKVPALPSSFTARKGAVVPILRRMEFLLSHPTASSPAFAHSSPRRRLTIPSPPPTLTSILHHGVTAAAQLLVHLQHLGPVVESMLITSATWIHTREIRSPSRLPCYDVEQGAARFLAGGRREQVYITRSSMIGGHLLGQCTIGSCSSIQWWNSSLFKQDSHGDREAFQQKGEGMGEAACSPVAVVRASDLRRRQLAQAAVWLNALMVPTTWQQHGGSSDGVGSLPEEEASNLLYIRDFSSTICGT